MVRAQDIYISYLDLILLTMTQQAMATTPSSSRCATPDVHKKRKKKKSKNKNKNGNDTLAADLDGVPALFMFSLLFGCFRGLVAMI